MVSDANPRRSRLVIRRVGVYCLLLVLPVPLLVVLLLMQVKIEPVRILLLASLLLMYLIGIATALLKTLNRPLQTLANVVAALRDGDFSFRAHEVDSQDALGELAAEINAMASLLQKQRVRSLEATALLASILEVMNAPLFAFNREGKLQLVNNAGVLLLGRAEARCIGAPARELGLEELLAAADQTIHSFASKPTRWLLRKATFRQDGAPHTLLLLADVSIPLQEEEQVAWKRLIRVLGHELSNSLTPIKSISGSLRLRLGALSADEDLLCDFNRGLSVIESRADALHRFVQSYRQLAQLPPPRLKQVKIAPLIERTVHLDQRYPVQIASGPAAILCVDPDQIEQLLINLLANAIDASLSSDTKSICDPIRVSWRIENAKVVIAVEDCGPGIANADNLFVPFYTTKPTGSGVGLVLAQQIARAHGGEIRLVNRNDSLGARATIHLPLSV
jgi:nitrogen fixation/metabolism regulation signal transduction histidine kinase